MHDGRCAAVSEPAALRCESGDFLEEPSVRSGCTSGCAMFKSGAPDDALDEDSLRWQKNDVLCIGNQFSVARASERERWRGSDGATNAVIVQALESVGVSSKAVSAL